MWTKLWNEPGELSADEIRTLVETVADEWTEGVTPGWTYRAKFLFWKLGAPAVVPLAEALTHEHACFWAATTPSNGSR